MGIETLLARRTFIAGAVLLALSGCATGLWPADDANAFPPLDPAKGRVFIYRNSTFGTSYTPEAQLNGQSVGKLDRRGVYFRDVAPGSYAVTTPMTARVANFAIRAGERKYVKLTGGMFDANMHPELVDSATGEAESSGLEQLGPRKK